jgi:hypothetical protein
MADATGEAKEPPLRVTFDCRLKLEFHGAKITSDGGLLAYRELDDALDLTTMATSTLEGRRGRNIRHRLLGLLRHPRSGFPPFTLPVAAPLAGLRLTNGPSRSTVEPRNGGQRGNLGLIYLILEALGRQPGL